MRLRAEAVLKLDAIMLALSKDDQASVAFEVWRTYGNTLAQGVLPTTATPFGTPNGDGKHHGSASGGGVKGGRSLPKRRDPQREKDSVEVLQFLNLKASKSYRPVEENLRFIHARLATCSVEDMKGVIARKCREWLNTDMATYLRPSTLFNATKFEAYLGEQSAP